ncbi:MAG: hypothetical protein ACT4PL_11300 [Phycisphaerales bacterium]
MSAKKEDAKAPAAAPAPEAGGKKGLPVKTIGVVGVIMVLEAVMVVGAVMMFGPKKTVAEVQEHAVTEDPGAEITEIPVADEKYQNLQQGKVWFWDIAIVVQAKAKNVEAVENRLKQRNAEISEGLGQIVSRAQPQHLKEPDRQTLNRQFTAYLSKLFGNDAEGNALIERVLIPRCRGMPGEF